MHRDDHGGFRESSSPALHDEDPGNSCFKGGCAVAMKTVAMKSMKKVAKKTAKPARAKPARLTDLSAAARRAAAPGSKKSARPAVTTALKPTLVIPTSVKVAAIAKAQLKHGKNVPVKASKSLKSTAKSVGARPRGLPVASEIAEAMFGEMMAGEESIVAREAARGLKERDLLARLAISMNRSDEMPNLELAANIVFNLDEESISILVSIIERHDDVHAPDAARVLSEVGARDLSLLLPVSDRLVGLCDETNAEMLPYTMTALAPMAHKFAEQLWDRRDLFWSTLTATTPPSEMAQAAAVRLLSALCAAGPDYARTLAGGLVDLLGKCMPKDVAFFAESVLPALGTAHSHRAKPVLDRRMKELTPAEVARLRRAVRAAQTGGGIYAAA
jgi:hypothetical protein